MPAPARGPRQSQPRPSPPTRFVQSSRPPLPTMRRGPRMASTQTLSGSTEVGAFHRSVGHTRTLTTAPKVFWPGCGLTQSGHERRGLFGDPAHPTDRRAHRPERRATRARITGFAAWSVRSRDRCTRSRRSVALEGGLHVGASGKVRASHCGAFRARKFWPYGSNPSRRATAREAAFDARAR